MRTAPAEALLDPPPRLKPRGNAATGAPFVDWVLDFRLRGNDGWWRVETYRAKESELLMRTLKPGDCMACLRCTIA